MPWATVHANEQSYREKLCLVLFFFNDRPRIDRTIGGFLTLPKTTFSGPSFKAMRLNRVERMQASMSFYVRYVQC